MMRKLGIIGAMKEEVALLQEKLERPAVTRRAEWILGWRTLRPAGDGGTERNREGQRRPVRPGAGGPVRRDPWVNTGLPDPWIRRWTWRCGHFLRGDVS